MSNRSLLEFNHDLGPRARWTAGALADYALGIAHYLSSGDKSCLPDGVTFIQMRHHSDPEPTGWVPPQDREPGFSCFGFMGGRWRDVWWNPDGYWETARFGKMWCRTNAPTAFLPMPPPPSESPAPQTVEAGR